MAPQGPHGEGLLADTRKVAQQIGGVLALLVDVQAHVVDARKGQEGHLVAFRKARLDLHLSVDVVGKERKAQEFEEQLQVGLPQRKEVRRFPAERAVAAHPHLRGPERRLEGVLPGVPVAQPEVEHRAQRPGAVGRKGPRIEADLLHKVGVDEAHGAARGALRGEMVDVRDLDAVHEELVLRGAAAPHDQVVAVAHGREGDPRIGAHDARDVAVRPGALLDLPHADDLKAHGALGRRTERCGTHRHGLDLRGVLLQLDLEERRGRGDHVFGGQQALVAHRRDRQAPDARAHALEAEAPERIARRPDTLLPGQYHGGIGHRLAAQAVDHPAADRIGGLLGPGGGRCKEHEGRAQQSDMEFQRHSGNKGNDSGSFRQAMRPAIRAVVYAAASRMIRHPGPSLRRKGPAGTEIFSSGSFFPE